MGVHSEMVWLRRTIGRENALLHIVYVCVCVGFSPPPIVSSYIFGVFSTELVETCQLYAEAALGVRGS